MTKPILADEQWKKIEPLLPQPKQSKRRKRGRPLKANCQVLEGILWMLKTGARWRDLPKDFGVSFSVCWKRLRPWEAQGVWLQLWRAFLLELDEKDKLDWDEVFLDGSFASANKGASVLAKPSAAKARSGWWWSMARVYPWEAS